MRCDLVRYASSVTHIDSVFDLLAVWSDSMCTDARGNSSHVITVDYGFHKIIV